MKQELQYLREELNYLLCSHHEHANKTINMVLLIWGSATAVLGTAGVKLVETSIEKAPLYFIGATIFFISNLILYLAARKYHAAVDEIFNIAAYITVFYEKRPSNITKVGKNFSWELANFEIMYQCIKSGARRKKSFYEKNAEYKVLILISLVLISIIYGLYFYTEGTIGVIYYIMLLTCVIYIAFSIYLFYKVPKYTSLKDDFGRRVRYLNTFFQYALDTGHYTLEEIQDRLAMFIKYVNNIHRRCRVSVKTEESKENEELGMRECQLRWRSILRIVLYANYALFLICLSATALVGRKTNSRRAVNVKRKAK